MKKIRGSISIYLCIIFLSIIVLISVLAEKSRVSVIQAKCKAVTYMATESILAGYGRQVFKDYGLLLAWENTSVEESLREYMQANIKKADLKGTGTNFMEASMVDIADCNKKYITDEGGDLFLEQVKKYIKYAGLMGNAETLVKTFTNYTENNETDNKEENKNITSVADKTSDELTSIVEDITEKIDILREVEELREKYTAFKKWKVEKNSKNLSRSYKKIVIILKDMDNTAREVINQINDYKRQRNIFLEENGYADNISDYMEDNLEISEKVKDEIIEINKLNLSKISEWNSQYLNETNLCEEKLKNILREIENLSINEVTEKDEKNVSIFKSAKELMNKGVFALVIEDTKNISQNAISTINLPSNLKSKKSEKKILDKATLLVYGNVKFGNYIKTKKNTALKYEKEYLISGKSSDRDNLSETITQIIAMRNVINVGILLTDSNKIREVSSISNSVAIVTGLPFMEVVAKAVIIEAWALAESIYEVKALLKEEKIPIIKKKEDWNTKLNNLLKEPEKVNNREGLNYENYCDVILMLRSSEEIAYRMMDLIQENIQLKYNSEFLMEKCFSSLEVKTTFEIKPLFMAMPWTLNISGGEDTYRFQVLWENSY